MPKIAYLTIDDAPFSDFRERVDFLESKGIQAIWYCLGFRMKDMMEEMIYAVKKGHIIGNHSYEHLHFSELTVEEAKSQILSNDLIIEEIYKLAGIAKPFKTFRFPYLDNGDGSGYLMTNWADEKVSAIQEFLKSLGYSQPHFKGINYKWYEEAGLKDSINVDATYDTYDWCLGSKDAILGYETSKLILARLDENLPKAGRGLNDKGSNEIVLMHAFPNLNLFQALIEGVLSKGIVFELPNE